MAVAAKEKGLVHAKLRFIGRDPLTGEPRHKEFVQKYTVREWNELNPHKIGYELLEEIHLPKNAVSKLEAKEKPSADKK